MNVLKQISISIFTMSLFCFMSPIQAMQNNLQKEKSWVQEASSCKHAGSWIATDKNSKPIIVEGEMLSKDSKIVSSDDDLNVLSAMFADTMQKPLIDLANSSRMVCIFSKLAKVYTGKNLRDRLFYSYINEINKAMSQKGNNLSYIFTVSEPQSNGKKLLLGSVIFNIKKHYAYGAVELDHFVIKPEAQGRGLSTILASAIFKLLPDIKRIILDVAYTNKKAMGAYEHFGFKKCPRRSSPIRQAFSQLDVEYMYEYLTNKHQKLQSIAAKFENIKI
jgi:ribosomal protein S18 acetylase RimI-like enzyme